MSPIEKPEPDQHIDPKHAEELKLAEERSRARGSERAEQIHFATESQRAATEQAKANGASGIPPAATPGIENVRDEMPQDDSYRDYGPVDRVLLSELQELKKLTDMQSAYQVITIALLGACAAFLAVRFFRSIKPPDITGG